MAVLVSIAIVSASTGLLVIEIMEERAEELRIIAELEAEEQRLLEEAEAEQQAARVAAINFIDERIAEGYEDWTDLITWAERNNIAWNLSENEEKICATLMERIMTYGIFGNYLGAAGSGTQDDSNEIVLLLNFENLTYQETIAELFQLNEYSLEELNDWLEDDGLERIEAAFYNAFVLDVNKDGREITEEPEFGKSFSYWSFEFDHFASFENTSIYIERTYEVATSQMDQFRIEAGISSLNPDASSEEVHEFVISMLDAMDKNEYISIGQVRHSGYNTRATTILSEIELAELFGIDHELLVGHITFNPDNGIRRINQAGDALNRSNVSLRIIGELDESTFISWDFEYEIDNRNRIGVTITIVHDARVAEVSLERFKMIEDGMTLHEVREIFGFDGGLSFVSGNVEVHQWLSGDVLITFTDGVVTAKEQSGL